MKSLLFAAAMVVSSVCMAEIKNSDYHPRHQKLIEEAIYKECGLSGTVIQVSSEELRAEVDQGIEDVYYTTELKIKVGVDQYLYDEYSAVVKSEYGDFYDHDAADWGFYRVNEVSCKFIK